MLELCVTQVVLQLDLAAQWAAAASQPAGWYRPTAYSPTDRPVARGDSPQQKCRPICTHFWKMSLFS